jgi:GNAT superfamily N-acetyltransferase
MNMVNKTRYYFAIDIKDLQFPDCFDVKYRKLNDNYNFIVFDVNNVPFNIVVDWIRLFNRKWDIRPNSIMMFIYYGDILVSSMYIVNENNVGTFHSAYTHPNHRKKGFYRFLAYKGMELLIDRGINCFELETAAPHLWKVWEELGFKRVSEINDIGKSRSVRELNGL